MGGPPSSLRLKSNARFVRQAAANGVEVDSYAASLLERAAQAAADAPSGTTAKDMVELFAPIRGLFADGELDFSRNPSTGRPIDLS